MTPVRSAWSASPVCMEPLLQPLPAFEVFMLKDAGFYGVAGGTEDKPGLKHERQRVRDVLRFQLGPAGAVAGLVIGPVPGHAVVQAGSAGKEAFGLGIV